MGSVDKNAVTRLESKLRDCENRLELEQSLKQRFEVSIHSECHILQNSHGIFCYIKFFCSFLTECCAQVH